MAPTSGEADLGATGQLWGCLGATPRVWKMGLGPRDLFLRGVLETYPWKESRSDSYMAVPAQLSCARMSHTYADCTLITSVFLVQVQRPRQTGWNEDPA